MFSDPNHLFLPPRGPGKEGISPSFMNSICAALVTRFDNPKIKILTVQKHIQNAKIQTWGCVRMTDSEDGDTIRASKIGKVPEDARDATFVRVWQLFYMLSVYLLTDNNIYPIVSGIGGYLYSTKECCS